MKLCFIILFSYLAFVKSVTVDKTLHDGNNQLTTRMFSEVVNINRGKSFVMSAFSLITPLSQLAEATEGPSHDELLNAIGFPDDNTTNAIFALIDSKFSSIKDVELKKASKLYIPLEYQVHESFAAVSKNVYHSEIENINFSNSKNTADEINTWVEDQTNHRIKNLVDPNSINADTRAVLVNALYFKGSWKYPFSNYTTRIQEFYENKEKTIQVQMMHNTEDYRYKESETLNAKLLELPYNGDQFSFLIVLPNDIEGLGQLIEKLKDPNIIDEEVGKMWTVEVRASIPKFKIETTTDLKDVLTKMHVTKIFGEDANLTKLLKTDETLYVSNAVQKAFIEINEQGAEAAAANAFGFAVATSLVFRQTYEFVADHPFAYFLKMNDEILFNGVFYGS